MVILHFLLAVYWFGLFISLFFGYEPNTFTVGTSLFLTGNSFVYLASCNMKEKGRRY